MSKRNGVQPPRCEPSRCPPNQTSASVAAAWNWSSGPEAAAEPLPVIVRPLHWAFGMSIVTVTPRVDMDTLSDAPGTVPPVHVAGLLQLPLCPASNALAMLTPGDAPMEVRTPPAPEVFVGNTVAPRAPGVPRFWMLSVPVFAPLRTAPVTVMTHGFPAEPSPVTAEPAPLKPAPESYELLSTGVMDGTLFPAESAESFKIEKIIRYATTFPGGLYNTSFVFVMNQAKYDSLPPDVKKAIDEMSGEFLARMAGRAWDKADRRGIALMQANGVEFTKADAAFVNAVKAKTAPLEDAWIKAAEGRGLKDGKKVLADFRGEISKLEQ